MATFKLSDIRDAAEKKYGDVIFDLGDGVSVALVPGLRLTRVQRKALGKINEANTEGETKEPEEIFAEWATIVARTPDEADVLIEAIGDDLPTWKSVQDTWAEVTQPGEASSSES